MNLKIKCALIAIGFLTFAFEAEARGGGRGGRGGGSRGGSRGGHSRSGHSSSSHGSSSGHSSSSYGSSSFSHGGGSSGGSSGFHSLSSGRHGINSYNYGSGSNSYRPYSHESSSGYGSSFGHTGSYGSRSHDDSSLSSYGNRWKPFEPSYSIPNLNSYGMSHNYGNRDFSRNSDHDGLLTSYRTGSVNKPDLSDELLNLFTYRRLLHNTHSSGDSHRNSYPWDTTTTESSIPTSDFNYPLYGNKNLDEILNSITNINGVASSMLEELPKIQEDSETKTTTTTTTERVIVNKKDPLEFLNSLNPSYRPDESMDEFLERMTKINFHEILTNVVESTRNAMQSIETTTADTKPETTTTTTTVRAIVNQRDRLEFLNSLNPSYRPDESMDEFLERMTKINFGEMLTNVAESTRNAMQSLETTTTEVETANSKVETSTAHVETTTTEDVSASTPELPVTNIPTLTTSTGFSNADSITKEEKATLTVDLPPVVTEASLQDANLEISTPYGVICYPIVYNKINEFGVNVTIESVGCYPAPAPIVLENVQQE